MLNDERPRHLFIMKMTSLRSGSTIAGLVCALGATPAGAIDTQSQPHFGADAAPAQTIECGPASAQLCPETSLFRHLPELMRPSDSGDTVLHRPESSPYRELELVPRPMIVPVVPPGTGDILLERHPGDPG